MATTPAHVSVGEVIESTTTRFRAQSHVLNEPPPFGAFVRVGAPPDSTDPFEAPRPADGTLYAVVAWAETTSLEAGRRPAAYGLDEETLRREQPQIYELLATQFECLVIGHADGGALRPYLPPRPAPLHRQVYACETNEVALVTARLDFLRTIVGTAECEAPDELMAAALRGAAQARNNDREFVIRVGKELALLLRDDFERLSFVLRKLVG